MIKSFKEYIEESVFDDIISRSKGNETRREDDINHLDKDGLYIYLLNHYEKIGVFDIMNRNDWNYFISIPVVAGYGNSCNALTIDYTKGKQTIKSLYISEDIFKVCPKVKEIMCKQYNIRYTNRKIIYIRPINEELTNKFCLEILNLILDNTDKPMMKKI